MRSSKMSKLPWFPADIRWPSHIKGGPREGLTRLDVVVVDDDEAVPVVARLLVEDAHRMGHLQAYPLHLPWHLELRPTSCRTMPMKDSQPVPIDTSCAPPVFPTNE